MQKHQKHTKKYLFLIISCTGGAGHIRAGQALHQTAAQLNLPVHTIHLNILDFTPKYFKKLYAQTYLNMVKYVPELWGYFYNKLEYKNYAKNHFIKIFDKFNYKNYINTILKINPDGIICTHFLPYISISDELRKLKFKTPIFAVTTDFEVHQMWIDKIVEKYFVFSSQTAKILEHKGVDKKDIIVTGIPLVLEFRKRYPKKVVRKILGLNSNYFTIMILSGGFGVGNVIKMVQESCNVLGNYNKTNFNLIIVCGNNTKLKNKINNLKYPVNVNPHIYGFIENIHQMMDASNLLISKSGGLTSSEALAKGLPMLIIDPIPGQEVRNAEFIVDKKAGWRVSNLKEFSYRLNDLIQHPDMLIKASKAAKAFSKPDAAEKILKYVLNYVNKKASTQV